MNAHNSPMRQVSLLLLHSVKCKDIFTCLYSEDKWHCFSWNCTLHLERFIIKFFGFCSLRKHWFRACHMLDRKERSKAKVPPLVNVHSIIIKNKLANKWEIKYFSHAPLEFIISFFLLLLSWISIGVEIIVTFPRDHPQEMRQEDSKENK